MYVKSDTNQSESSSDIELFFSPPMAVHEAVEDVDPRTPECNRQAERQREREWQELQMTSPRVRRQRVQERPVHIEQPLFATPLSQRPPEYSGMVPLPGWTPPLAHPPQPQPLGFQQQQIIFAVNPTNFSGLAPLPGWTAPVTVTAAPHPQGFQQQQHVFAVNPPITVPVLAVHHPPVPVLAYPGLPRHAIAHHDRQAAHRLQLLCGPIAPQAPPRTAIAIAQPDAPAPPPPHHAAVRPRPNACVQMNNCTPQGCGAYVEPNARHSIGRMNVECPHCHALHWIGEKLASSSVRTPKFGVCCLQGQVVLPHPQPPPLTLQNLLTGNNTKARGFQEKIRQYNSAFAFTSVAVKVDQAVLTAVCRMFGTSRGKRAN